MFSLRHTVAGFTVSECQKDDKAALADHFQTLSRMTWGQIVQAPRTGLGIEGISQDGLRVSLPRHITPDRNLIAMHFGAKARIVGYREDEVLYVIWIDPEHRVYDP